MTQSHVPFVVALLADLSEGLGGQGLGLFGARGIAKALAFASSPALLPPLRDGLGPVPRYCESPGSAGSLC